MRIDVDVAGRDVVGVGQLAPDPGEEARHERLVAEDRAALDRRGRVAPDRPIGRPQLDPWQLRRPRGERLEPELEPGRDGAADEGAVAGDAVERRRGPEVDDDRGRAVQARGGQGIDEPVRTDLARPVDADGQRHRARAGKEQRPLAPGGDGLERRGHRRHDRCDGDRGDVGEGRVVEAEEAFDAGAPARRRAAARRRGAPRRRPARRSGTSRS